MSDAADPPLTLRAAPRAVRRFNKRALLLAASVVAVAIAASVCIALAPPQALEEGPGPELYNIANVPKADALAELPATYAEMAPPPLGPPLPGEWGNAVLAAERAAGVTYVPPLPDDPTPFRASREIDAEREARLAAAQVAEAARQSGVFFQLTRGNGAPPRAASAAGGGHAPSSPFGFPMPVEPPEPAFGASLQEDPNRQQRKLDFLGKEVDPDVYNPHQLQDPVSPYQVMAGSMISASLITGLNSDLPGNVIAQVTENVYDTVTGTHLLIPQGSRLLGVYDSVVAFGQDRALLVWQRIIFPDGSSIVIENLPATDTAGYAGLEDEVDFHTWRLLQGVALSTVLGIGTELVFDDDDDDDSDLVEALRESTQRAGDRAGQRIVNRALNIQPTITVRPGWPLKVIVNKDLVLRPYGAPQGGFR